MENSSMWNTDFDWPFKTPPTRDFLSHQGADIDNWHLLALNECPLPPVDATAQYIADILPYLNRYPDNIQQDLVQAITQKTGVSADLQIWGNGASDLINRAISIATQNQLEVVSPSPTFWGYERAYRLQQAAVKRTPLDTQGAIDVDALLAAITPQTGIVTFATPGNPSGVSLTAEAIERIAKETPDNALLMIDEVYQEFCVHEGGPDALEIVRRVRKAPWVVLRSFSKAYRLAGARVGYGMASDTLTAKRLREHCLNFTVSTLSYAAALAAYRDTDGLQHYLTNNLAEKVFLSEKLMAMELTPLPSAANFVSVKLPVPAQDVLAALRRQHIACASWNHGDYPHFIRIGLGMRADSEAVLANLSENALLKTN
ncbi:MAG: pyridoxal phosphate-dependent aminotransferase [Thiolinea sp.]